ncbi:MAG TPA: DUF721 domain-containing protein [Acidimicrobiia bacterium]|nr:DUF721 domain-containing protein [Acidimicrobiia bacterium]
MNTHTLIPNDEIVRLEECENQALPTTLSIKECVSRFSETSVGSAALVVSSVHSLWEGIVGPDVAQHVHVRYVRDGVLYVAADHPAWGTQLKYMQESIVTELNKNIAGENITSVVMSVSRGK